MTTGDVFWIWTQLFSSWSFHDVACNYLPFETYWPLVQAAIGVGFFLYFQESLKHFWRLSKVY